MLDYKYVTLLEEISINAWPSHKMELYDGWMIRFSHNYTHRTNCVEQIGSSLIPVNDKVDYCEAIYQKYHTPSIFKISPLIDPAFDELLDKRGYTVEHRVDNMVLDLKDANLSEPQHIEYEFYGRNSGLPSIVSYDNDIIIQLRDRITEDWLNALFRLNGTTNPTLRRIVPSMYHAIPKEIIVAKIEIDGRMVASGLGILDRDHIGIYAIYVDPSCRGKGFGRSIVNTILLEGRKKGFNKAYLQCVRGNDIAKKMYENIGFKKLYECYFRVKENF